VTGATDMFNEEDVELRRRCDFARVNEIPNCLCEMSPVLMGWRGKNGGGVTPRKSRTVPRPKVKIIERVVLSVYSVLNREKRRAIQRFRVRIATIRILLG
jgi:hypothetical protein